MVSVALKIAREGLEMLSSLHEPAQDGVGIDRKDTGHGADAEPLSQSRNRPHKLIGGDLLGVKRRTKGFQEMPVAAETRQ